MPASNIMIFDSDTAKQLYIAYISTQDRKLLDQLHILASDLIKVIAYNLDRYDYYDDLVQEGHLKFHKLITNKKYDPANSAAMYTFLSHVLKNHMIDYLRKVRDHADLDTVIATYSMPDYYYNTEQEELFTQYYVCRFPSLPNSYAYAEYAYDAIIESVNHNKAITTLLLNDNITRQQALLVYRSVSIFLRIISLLDSTPILLSKSLKCANNGKEFTLYPECVLAGCEELSYKQLVERVNTLYGTQ